MYIITFICTFRVLYVCIYKQIYLYIFSHWAIYIYIMYNINITCNFTLNEAGSGTGGHQKNRGEMKTQIRKCQMWTRN